MEDSDEEFGFSNDIYRQYYQMTFQWPCLSFDVIRDNLGASRTQFPLTTFFVSATQAETDDENQLLVTKISNLQCTQNDDNYDDPAQLIDPKLSCCGNFHPGAANRVRIQPQQSNIVATWSDTGNVLIWDISSGITSVNNDVEEGTVQMIFECAIGEEGFGLCWSKVDNGLLAVGDNNGFISIWQENSGAFTRTALYEGHTDSVEDIVFSHSDSGIFMTCSCDGTIAVWDLRDPTQPVSRFQATDKCDCNVIDWNAIQRNLICSGADNGVIAIWDLRALSHTTEPVATMSYHEDPITSIEWNPNDESEFAAACEDGRVTIWDLSVEAMDPEEKEEGIPDQMMFEHVAEEPKEIHYHPQIPGMLAVTGVRFEVFIPDIQEDAGEAQ
ncbi:Glutamate-rich WD repeat-containing protein [Histomonas meleagridis]|uniref:Glutamate-rich WD repeat-containing protein n=1 Tax=Histomonas meleagridis TaxID=135588 RepID=UPI00355AC520|nr:Glutamate-rich WD repeat-containing protein [Histomonas meleagridis]KAH0805094.1 Glutamate-rich WD repeat-containing protein [Histomonas meleagridis]